MLWAKISLDCYKFRFHFFGEEMLVNVALAFLIQQRTAGECAVINHHIRAVKEHGFQLRAVAESMQPNLLYAHGNADDAQLAAAVKGARTKWKSCIDNRCSLCYITITNCIDDE